MLLKSVLCDDVGHRAITRQIMGHVFLFHTSCHITTLQANSVGGEDVSLHDYVI